MNGGWGPGRRYPTAANGEPPHRELMWLLPVRHCPACEQDRPHTTDPLTCLACGRLETER